MDASVVLGFAGLCLLLAITPGPDTFLVLHYGFTGTRQGVMAAAGSAIGSLFWAAAVGLGLSAFLAASASTFLGVKIIGGLYLLYLGLVGLRRCDVVVGMGTADSNGAASAAVVVAFRAGLFSCVLNPKVGLFFLAVVPQFLPAEVIGFGTIMVLGTIDSLVAFAWLVLVAVAAARTVSWLWKPRVARRLGWASSGILAVLGIGILTAAISP